MYLQENPATSYSLYRVNGCVFLSEAETSFYSKSFLRAYEIYYRANRKKNSIDKDTKLSASRAKVLAKKAISRYTEWMKTVAENIRNSLMNEKKDGELCIS